MNYIFQYQQQVTVFIVGYEDISSQKMKLLQQVNDVSVTLLKMLQNKNLSVINLYTTITEYVL